MFPNCLFLPYLQAQTVGLPVNMHSPNVRLMRSTLLPQASNVEAFSFPASGCQAEAAFMEEECVDTPKVRVCLRDSELAGRLETSLWSTGVVLCFVELCHFLKSLRSVAFVQKNLREEFRGKLLSSPSYHYDYCVTCQVRPHLYFSKSFLYP